MGATFEGGAALLQILLGVERQFDEPFEKVPGGKPGEVLGDELLGEKAADVTKF
jgi:hypothetical protein